MYYGLYSKIRKVAQLRKLSYIVFFYHTELKMSKIVLSGRNISKVYKSKSGKETKVLNGLDIDISRGEFAAIMGPSGVGKSTLLYILGSLDHPDTGEISISIDDKEYNYKNMQSDSLAEFRNKQIGFVFQFHHLLPEFTAIENVMMPALIAGVPYNEAFEKAEGLLKTVGVDIRSEHKPMELSGGEQQRVAIARALINDPVLVLADEPTGNLDKGNTSAVLELITKLREEYSITFVVATHSQDVAAIAEKVLIMGDGKIADIQEK